MCLACNFRIASNYHSRKHSALQSSPCTLLTLKVSTIKLLNLHAYWVSNKARQGSQNLYEYSPLSISDKARKAIGSTESIYPPMKLTAWYQVCTHPASSLFIFFWSYGGGPKDRYKDTSPGMQNQKPLPCASRSKKLEKKCFFEKLQIPSEAGSMVINLVIEINEIRTETGIMGK